MYLARAPPDARRAAIKFLLPELSQDSRRGRALLQRGARHRGHPAPRHRRDLRLRGRRRPRLHRHGVPGGREPGEAAARAGCAASPASPTSIAVGGRAASPARWRPRTPRASSTATSSPRTSSSRSTPAVAGTFSVKILDFGIAKLAGDSVVRPASQTQHRQRDGHAALHVAGAVPRHHGTIDHRADIYALGCIIFEMLTGRSRLPARGARRPAGGAYLRAASVPRFAGARGSDRDRSAGHRDAGQEPERSPAVDGRRRRGVRATAGCCGRRLHPRSSRSPAR